MAAAPVVHAAAITSAAWLVLQFSPFNNFLDELLSLSNIVDV